jgi:GNAT superfamily N-acetyltransferase
VSNNVILLQIQPQEAYQVSEMVAGCFHQFIAPDYSEEGVQEFLKYIDASKIKDRLSHDHFILAAIHQDQIVGVIEVRTFNQISLLFVRQDHQGKGVAKRLFNKSLEICRQNNTQSQTITVNSSPYAVEIYKKLGFHMVDVEKIVHGIRFTPMEFKFN